MNLEKDGVYLSASQQHLCELLKSKNPRLADMYIGALMTLQNKANPDRLSQAANSLRELAEKMPVYLLTQEETVVCRKNDGSKLTSLRKDFEVKIAKCKKGIYRDGWIKKEINSTLNKALIKVEEYLEATKLPNRQKQTADALSKINPFSLFSEEYDLQLQKAAKASRYFQDSAHHRSSDENELLKNLEEFEALLSRYLNPARKQVLVAIKRVIALPPDTITNLKQILDSIRSSEANTEYFFKNVSHTDWLAILVEHKIFQNPPVMRLRGAGCVSFPFWWPMIYLVRISNELPDQVVQLVLEIPATENWHVGNEILKIALKVDPKHSIRLKGKIIDYINNPYHVGTVEIANLLCHWLKGGEEGLNAATFLVGEIVPFKSDPKQDQKFKERKSNADMLVRLSSSLKPEPKFDEWEYQEILRKGVRPVAELRPLEVCQILANAIHEMIVMRIHPDDLVETKQDGSDGSEFWCQRIDPVDGRMTHVDDTLVHTLTYSCIQIFEKTPEKVSELFNFLATMKWNVFRRIQYFLCAQYPDKTESILKPLILNFDSYAKNDYGIEFFELLKTSCDRHGSTLFSEADWGNLFEQILSGPDRRLLQEFWGEEFTEEKFLQRQNVFYKKQFWPFKNALFGKYQVRFEDACRQIPGVLKEDDYAPLSSGGEAKLVSSISPVPQEHLSEKSDDELIRYLNEWDNPGRKPDEWWIEIDHSGLGKEFAELIQKQPDRFGLWESQWEALMRPIYLRYALQAACKLGKSRRDLKTWLRLCQVVSNEYHIQPQDDSKSSETSLESPNWNGAKIAVTDFLKVILSSESPALGDYFSEIHDLLKTLCLGTDPRLDTGWELLVNQKEPMTTAINTVRGRALEALLLFDRWAKKLQNNNTSSSSSEFITSILDLRFEGNPPLTEPEETLLGVHFYDLMHIDSDWTKRNVARLFPYAVNSSRWRVIFSSYLLFNDSHMGAFEPLKDNLTFAVENIDLLKKAPLEPKECIDRLGIHLVCYYLWHKCEFQEPTGLIQRFYQNADPLYWPALVNFLGRAIRDEKNLNSQHHPEIKARIQRFMEWRILETSQKIKDAKLPEEKKKYSEELLEFYWWIPSEGLEINWRLDTLKSILEVVTTSGKISCILEDLGSLLERDPSKVIECFKLITDQISPNEVFYMTKKEAGPILIRGLASEDPNVKKLAEDARENLLRAGRFEFLDLD